MLFAAWGPINIRYPRLHLTKSQLTLTHLYFILVASLFPVQLRANTSAAAVFAEISFGCRIECDRMCFVVYTIAIAIVSSDRSHRHKLKVSSFENQLIHSIETTTRTMLFGNIFCGRIAVPWTAAPHKPAHNADCCFIIPAQPSSKTHTRRLLPKELSWSRQVDAQAHHYASQPPLSFSLSFTSVSVPLSFRSRNRSLIRIFH